MAKPLQSRYAEFLEAEDGRLSITRLMVLLTWPPATWVLLANPEQLGNYLGFYVGGYAAGKTADIFTNGWVSGKSPEADSSDNSVGGDGGDSVRQGKGRVRG